MEINISGKEKEYLVALVDRIKRLCDVKGITVTKLCQSINVVPSYFTLPRDFSFFKILKICEVFPDVQIEWLFCGTGEMLSSPTSVSVEDFFDRINKIIEFKEINSAKFCQKIGKSVGFFTKKREVGISTIIAIIREFPDISLGWLLYGVGEIVCSIDSQKDGLDFNLSKDLIKIIQEKDKQIEAYNKQISEFCSILDLLKDTVNEYKKDKEFMRQNIYAKDEEIKNLKTIRD